ncbi:MAG: hypothetical protein BAJATHORv1_30202 [Candidatus Thorarchaeota archaeon]|nr:MAG: hypothetical protein BAJATHORv1_30202 [Candidatus Thorarchaeota archaeon]
MVLFVDEENKEIIYKLVKGRTMSVYALLLTHEKMGVREIQRELGFSSPSLAQHHLTKLMELNLVDKDTHGEYFITRTVRVGSLSLFVRIGQTLLPRFFFLVALIVSMLILYTFFFASLPLEGKDIMFYALCIICFIVVGYEGGRIWNLKPI